MLLSGLWNGAGLNFLVWGLWHGTLLVIHRLWTALREGSLMRFPKASPALGVWPLVATVSGDGVQTIPAILYSGTIRQSSLSAATPAESSPRSTHYFATAGEI